MPPHRLPEMRRYASFALRAVFSAEKQHAPAGTSRRESQRALPGGLHTQVAVGVEQIEPPRVEPRRQLQHPAAGDPDIEEQRPASGDRPFVAEQARIVRQKFGEPRVNTPQAILSPFSKRFRVISL